MARRDPISRLRHDLRTPLNHIVGYTELLMEVAVDAGEQARADELERVLKAARTLLTLIDENVVRARLEALLESDPYEEVVAEASRASAPDVESSPRRAKKTAGPRGRILIVDDNPANCEMLEWRLKHEGHSTATAHDGHKALEMLAAEPFDLVLLDILMPGLDGRGVLAKIKADPALRHIPVIMISALDQLQTVVQCIESGAEDYLPKPFDPTLLRARIGASLEKKALRDAEQASQATIRRTQDRLAQELSEASEYVRSMLPPPWTSGAVLTDWRLVPSTELGGDALGYHWIDEDHCAAYVLDVSGHGVGAALLSATAIKVLLTGALPDVDFRDPGSVLTALNEKFPMEQQNNMFFTLWYGVLDRRWGTLSYASAAHPAAVLVKPGASAAELVGQRGMVLGGMPGTVYQTSKCEMPPGSTLFLVSDGAYEIHQDGKALLDYPKLAEFLFRASREGEGELDALLEWVSAVHGAGPLDDDLTVLKVSVPLEPELKLFVRADLAQVPEANARTEEFLEAHQIQNRPRHALLVALEELLTNVVKYGYAGGPGEPIEVTVRLGGELELTVVDRAKAFDPLQGSVPDITAPVETREVGGLGLHLLRNLSLRQSYERRDDRNVVSLVFAR